MTGSRPVVVRGKYGDLAYGLSRLSQGKQAWRVNTIIVRQKDQAHNPTFRLSGARRKLTVSASAHSPPIPRAVAQLIKKKVRWA